MVHKLLDYDCNRRPSAFAILEGEALMEITLRLEEEKRKKVEEYEKLKRLEAAGKSINDVIPAGAKAAVKKEKAKKEKGEKALCACCLRNGHRIEETAQHEHHDCPTARAVWQQVAGAWLQATGESVDINSPLLTIMGLRARPAGLTGAAREKWDALEPAWRLTHAQNCAVSRAFPSQRMLHKTSSEAPPLGPGLGAGEDA